MNNHSISRGIGVIGAGTVGGGVITALLTNRDVIRRKAGVNVALKRICELRPDCLKELDLPGVRVTQDADALIADPEVDIVCELIGGIEPAKTLIMRALEAGKNVVTANKMLLAHHGPQLCAAAKAHGVDLRYEAAVAGAIPIIKALREGLASNNIEFVYGILNGTCNYILSRMTYEGLEFEDALQQATDLGFAETPPDLDIEGLDTAHKCQIIASICYSTQVALEQIFVEGVTKVTRADVAYARELGYLIKLLAIVRSAGDDIEVRVHPTLVPETHLLASVRNEFNAVFVKSDIADATMYYGRGAGRMPTASAVVADILDIARRDGAPAPPPFVYAAERRVRDMGAIRSRYYLRWTTLDTPGVLGSIGTLLGSHGVSIASCIQKERQSNDSVHLIMMTHETKESALRTAIAEVGACDFITEETHVLRVL